MERWLFESGWPYAIVLTKSDKLTRQEQFRRLESFESILLPGRKGLYAVSAEKRTGLDALWQTIADAAGVENEQPGREKR